jgi:hypothetical protein
MLHTSQLTRTILIFWRTPGHRLLSANVGGQPGPPVAIATAAGHGPALREKVQAHVPPPVGRTVLCPPRALCLSRWAGHRPAARTE